MGKLLREVEEDTWYDFKKGNTPCDHTNDEGMLDEPFLVAFFRKEFGDYHYEVCDWDDVGKFFVVQGGFIPVEQMFKPLKPTKWSWLIGPRQ